MDGETIGVSDEKKTKLIYVRVSDAMKKKIEEKAGSEKKRPAKFVRDAIEEKLDKENP